MNEELGDENDGVSFHSSLVFLLSRANNRIADFTYLCSSGVMDGLPADQINDTLKLIFYANGHLNCSNGHTVQSLLRTVLVGHAPRVRARSERQCAQN